MAGGGPLISGGAHNGFLKGGGGGGGGRRRLAKGGPGARVGGAGFRVEVFSNRVFSLFFSSCRENFQKGGWRVVVDWRGTKKKRFFFAFSKVFCPGAKGGGRGPREKKKNHKGGEKGTKKIRVSAPRRCISPDGI